MPSLGEQLHGVAACSLQPLFGSVDCFRRLPRLRLPHPRLFTDTGRFGGSCFQKEPVRLTLRNQTLQMEPCLLKFCRAGRGTRLQFCNAFLVAYFPRGGALQFDGRLVGARVGVFRARVQLIAARHALE